MIRIRTGWTWSAALLAACSTPSPRTPRLTEDTSPKTFVVAPYVWLTSAKGEAPDGEGEGTDIDLVGLDDLEAALMLAFEARPPGSDWTFLFDSLYVRFDNEERLLRVETGGQLIEAAAAWGPAAWNSGAWADVELLAGLRYWRLFADIDLGTVASSKQEETWIDPLLGARATRDLGGAWSLHGRADVGGFGVEVDWIWQLRADVRYALNSCWELELGYRYLSIEFDDFGYDTALSGPSLGARWSF